MGVGSLFFSQPSGVEFFSTSFMIAILKQMPLDRGMRKVTLGILRLVSH